MELVKWVVMQICPHLKCKADNQDNATYCVRCGKKLPEPHLRLLGRGQELRHFRIVDLLGKGGFGVVYHATHKDLNKSVAIKENIRPDEAGAGTPAASSEGFRTAASNEQFLEEARILASLDHPNLPEVSHYFIENYHAQGRKYPRQYLVMKFISGRNLLEEMECKGLARLEESAALEFMGDILDAVIYLHSPQLNRPEPIIHRDIKPENIMITPEGKAVLLDLGIAKVGGEDAATRMGAKGAGTPGYAPPEQRIADSTSQSSDIYALGATFYHILTGQIPPDSYELEYGQATLTPLRQLNPDVSAPVAAAIEKAMQLRRENRFASVNEFKEALQAKPAPAPSSHQQICPNFECRADNRGTAKHCGRCGTALLDLLGREAMLRNRYRIDDLLGRGGHAAVYRATDLLKNRIVALKENKRSKDSPSDEQFYEEARMLAQLEHPNLPDVIDQFIEPNGKQCLVMEFVPGKNLEEVVKASSSGLSEPHALGLMQGVFDAVSYLHSQKPPIIHRDIKPSNIIVTPENQAVLVDFGIAKVGGKDVKTRSGAGGWTVYYAPLEQLSGERTSEKSDVYSLGATLYSVLMGEHPPSALALTPKEERAKWRHELNRRVSPALAAAIDKALSTRLEDRFANVEQFREALQVKAAPPPPPLPPQIFPDLECPACRANNPDTAEYCEVCGGPLGVEPSSADYWNELGTAHFNQGKYAEAEAAYQKATQLEPSNANYWNNLGLACGENARYLDNLNLGMMHPVQDKYAEAEAALLKATQLEPSSADCWNGLGSSLFRQDKYAEAETAFQKVAQLEPSNADYWNNLGLAHHSQQKFDEAEAAYLKATQLEPSNADYWSNLGLARGMQQKHGEAETAFRKATQIKPSDAEFCYNLGSALFCQDKYAEAETAYQKATQLEPSNADYQNKLGNALFCQEKFGEARIAFYKATQLEPSNALYWNNLGLARERQEKYVEAETAFQKATQLDPSNADYWNNLGRSLFEQDRYAEAETAFRKATQLAPSDALYWNNLGLARERRNKYVEAETAYQKAVQLEPSNIDYGNNLSLARARQSKETEAETASKFQEVEQVLRKAVQQWILRVDPGMQDGIGNDPVKFWLTFGIGLLAFGIGLLVIFGVLVLLGTWAVNSGIIGWAIRHWVWIVAGMVTIGALSSKESRSNAFSVLFCLAVILFSLGWGPFNKISTPLPVKAGWLSSWWQSRNKPSGTSANRNKVSSGSRGSLRGQDSAAPQDENHSLVRTLTGHSGDVHSLAFSPDGSTLASAGSDPYNFDEKTKKFRVVIKDRTVRLWDVQTGQLKRTLTGNNGKKQSLAFSPDGEILAGAEDSAVRFWDARTGQLKRTLTGHNGRVNEVAFSPDSQTLASAGSDGTIKLWDVPSGTVQQTLKGYSGGVNSVAFSPDGKILVSGGSDVIKMNKMSIRGLGVAKVRLWDVRTGSLQRTLKTDAARDVAFSPDGKLLAGSGGLSASAQLWDVRTGVPRRTLFGGSSHFTFSPDSKLLASARSRWRYPASNAIELWNVQTGIVQSTLGGYHDNMSSVAFSPDGKLLASGSEDNTIKLWRIE